MYKVNFHSQRGSVVETGVFLVCASNAEQAEGMVAGTLNVPPSTARFDTGRVKPSIYELSHREFSLKEAIPLLGVVGGSSPQEEVASSIHEVTASAKVVAYSESVALRRFAQAIDESARMASQPLVKHVNDLNIQVEKANERVRPSRVEEQSIYREKRFFAGGSARPR